MLNLCDAAAMHTYAGLLGGGRSLPASAYAGCDVSPRLRSFPPVYHAPQLAGWGSGLAAESATGEAVAISMAPDLISTLKT
jgi:hypothetical protein